MYSLYAFINVDNCERPLTHPGKPGQYCNLIIRIPGLACTGISSKFLENLKYEPIFGAVFLPCLYL